MSSRPPLGAARVKRRRRGDKRHRHAMPCLLKMKSGGHKNLPLPYDLWRLWDYIYLSFLLTTRTRVLLELEYRLCYAEVGPRL